MDQDSAIRPKPQGAAETAASQDGDERPEHEAAQERYRDYLAGLSFDRLLAEIGEAMGDDWPVRRDGSLRRFR